MKKKEINIGVGKEPASAEAAGGDQCEVLGSFGVVRDYFIPEAEEDGFDYGGALGNGRASFAVGGKFLLDARGFPGVQVP
jgi:hypothetical protein